MASSVRALRSYSARDRSVCFVAEIACSSRLLAASAASAAGAASA